MMKLKSVLQVVLLTISALTVDAQLLNFGNQANIGVREAMLAINAYCDNNCAPMSSQNVVAQCFDLAIAQNEPIIQILRSCTAQTGFTINCNPNSLVLLERCVLPLATTWYGMQMVSQMSRQCFRRVLQPATINCLRLRYPRLNRFLPLGPLFMGSTFSSPGRLAFF